MNLLEQETHPIFNIPYGLCHCGCGEKTTLAPHSASRGGWIKGQPIRYLAGHNKRLRRPPLDDKLFVFKGELCRRISLGKVHTIVSEADYDFLMQWTWKSSGPANGPYYAHCLDYETKKTYRMHCLIAKAPEGLMVDHRNGDTLDNRRSNLRPATHSQNCANQRVNRLNTSGHKGVSRYKNGMESKNWVSRNLYIFRCICTLCGCC